jgi:hypothetical protein
VFVSSRRIDASGRVNGWRRSYLSRIPRAQKINMHTMKCNPIKL